jgi:Asp/Glu/hydantoin racemase
MKRRVALIHASRAAVDPVMHYYTAQAPDWELTNLLDDGVMRALAGGDSARTRRRLGAMIGLAREEYGAESALLTCSAVSREEMRQLRDAAAIPLIKIDEPMARLAVASGRRIGVVATFPATAETTRRLIEEAAAEAGREVEIQMKLEASAIAALLAGDAATHDEQLLNAAGSFATSGMDCLVLAQVSMARLAGQAAARAGMPVWNSLDTSLEAVKQLLSQK